MTNDSTDQTPSRQPTPQYSVQPASPPLPDGELPPADLTPPKSPSRGPVDETAWVRSVYLFAACGASGVLMIVGLLLAVGSLVSVVSPDSGLRDGWDRGLVGATAVVDEGIDVFDEFSRMQLEDDFEQFCDSDTDDEYCDDLETRIDEEGSTIPDELADNIGLIRNEVHRQIRVAAIAKLVGGLVLSVIGFLLFRFHSKQVTVYAKRA